MTILDTIKKSFKITIGNPSITLCLVIFLIFLNILASYIKTPLMAIISFLATSAFFSGWFQVVKETFDIEKLKEKKLGTTFFEGVGKNIIPTTLGMIFSIIIFNLVAFALTFIASKIFGTLEFISQDMATISQDADSIAKYLQSLTPEKLYAIYGWALSGIIAMGIYGFLMLFYMPAIISNDKNNIFLKPIIGIAKSICFVFKNFIGSFAIYALISTIYVLLVLFNALFAKNIILSMLMLFVYVYFISFVVVLIFNYYGQKNNHSDGADSIGENQCIDSTGEEI